MSKPSYRDLGFWRSVSRMRIREFLGAWDFWVALLLAGPGTVFYVHIQTSVTEHVNIAGDFLTLTGALFGVVLAGLAIVAALIGDRYARFLRAAGSTSLDVLSQFVVVSGMLVAAIVGVIIYRAVAEAVARDFPIGEQVFLWLTFFLVLWSLFAALQMVKLIFGIAVASVEQSLLDDGEETPRSSSAATSRQRRP